jgi:hypothetical protein
MYQLIFSDRKIYLADTMEWDAEQKWRTFQVTDAYSLDNLGYMRRGGIEWAIPRNEGERRAGILRVHADNFLEVRNLDVEPGYCFNPVRAKWAKEHGISDFQAAHMVDIGLLMFDGKEFTPAPGTEDYAFDAVRAYGRLVGRAM